jgi:electron transport complex protein RnfC
MISRLFKFHGGVHPPEHKLESATTPIRQVPVPERLVLPLRQHVGNVGKLLVGVGDHVCKGQLLAAPEGMISAAVHAPTSGTVVAIDEQLIPHVSGLPDLCVTLQSDGEDRWITRKPLDYRTMEKCEVIEALRMAGVVGLGGAAFPSHVKLRADPRHPVRTLVINGAECEPFITCDDRLMRERAAGIVRGVEIMLELLGAERCLVGIEDNKPEAAQAMQNACASSTAPIEVVLVPTLYPSGGAKQLIKILTGLEVPSGKLPTDIGVQCFNVATAYSVHRFIDHGEPVISRIVTVTGNVACPGNYETLLGMAIEELVQFAGGAGPDTETFIMGGPMMGFELPSPKVPVVKATNCIIAVSPGLLPAQPPPMPCIRCARCAEVCPVNLQPQELYWFAKSQNLERAREYNLFDCIECGCCSYVCPSHIPLVQYYRYAKSEILAADKAKAEANLARERHEFRLARLEREKQERAARHAQKAMGAKDDAAAEEAKKAAIAAAMERAKAQKAAIVPQNTEGLSAEAQAQLAEIDARRSRMAQTQED